MKKVFLLVLCLGCFFAFSEANAQSTSKSSKSKDEYWGTAKVEDKGSTVDAVGKRGEGLDKRFNTYEETSNRKRSYDKLRIKNSKRMKEILKKEKEMMKKHERDKKKLERKNRKRRSQ
ncbi:hypothetical protein ACSX1A_14580 [Pontibacter sp. MBLB2868]|uniref:hypothetical protein n=1 Tax=Pontibacter sp. MBLB2868 TaxID=3451555 RepID=UPI003F7561AD